MIRTNKIIIICTLLFVMNVDRIQAQSCEFSQQVIKNHVFAQRLYRDKLLSDRYRPIYHFVVPEGMACPFDPNGAFYWKGRYHLFYIIQTTEPKPYYRGDAWAHISSSDLVHWRFHPTALSPNEDTPERAIYSGNMFLYRDSIPTVIYQGLGAGQCIAKSAGDDMLDKWERSKSNPVIPYPEYAAKAKEDEYRFYLDELPNYGEIDVWDPHCFYDNGYYYAISGDNGTWPGKSGLYRSTDLEKWETLGSFFNHGEVEGTLDCPDFFKLGNKYVLLYLRNGLEYIIGDWKDEQFYPEKRGTMTWNLGVGYAPESLIDPKGRRIMWAALNDSRSGWGNLNEFLPKHGWMGTMSMPRVLTLDDDNNLLIEPIEELEILRYNPVHFENLKINNEVKQIAVEGDALEMQIIIDPKQAEEVGINILASSDGSEQTSIRYIKERGVVEIDLSKSSKNKEYMENFYDEKQIQVAELDLEKGEDLEFRIFIDKSVLEVFVNKKLCLTQRVYPTSTDNEVSIYSKAGVINVKEVNAWKMHPSNPF